MPSVLSIETVAHCPFACIYALAVYDFAGGDDARRQAGFLAAIENNRVAFALDYDCCSSAAVNVNCMLDFDLIRFDRYHLRLVFNLPLVAHQLKLGGFAAAVDRVPAPHFFAGAAFFLATGLSPRTLALAERRPAVLPLLWSIFFSPQRHCRCRRLSLQGGSSRLGWGSS